MSTRTAFVILLLGLSRAAAAGPANSPLPTFADGAPAQAVYAALGVIRNNNLETDVACTSFEATPVDIGFEVFDETGALRNNVGFGGTLCNTGSRVAQACTVDNSTDTVNGCPGAVCPGCCVPGSGAMLAVACSKCDRRGRLSVANLIAEHGADMRLPDLRDFLAGDCPRVRAASFNDPCAVHYPQLAEVP